MSAGATWARTWFSNASNWLTAETGLPRSTDAKAARNVASSGWGRAAFEPTTELSRSTAWAVVMTSTVIALVLAAIPSLTTSRIELAPTGNTTIATTPLARGLELPTSYHPYCNGSPSGSYEREPSRMTLALVPLGEMYSVLVAVASAIGGRLTRKVALELSTDPRRLLTTTE